MGPPRTRTLGEGEGLAPAWARFVVYLEIVC